MSPSSFPHSITCDTSWLSLLHPGSVRMASRRAVSPQRRPSKCNVGSPISCAVSNGSASTTGWLQSRLAVMSSTSTTRCTISCRVPVETKGSVIALPGLIFTILYLWRRRLSTAGRCYRPRRVIPYCRVLHTKEWQSGAEGAWALTTGGAGTAPSIAEILKDTGGDRYVQSYLNIDEIKVLHDRYVELPRQNLAMRPRKIRGRCVWSRGLAVLGTSSSRTAPMLLAVIATFTLQSWLQVPPA